MKRKFVDYLLIALMGISAFVSVFSLYKIITNKEANKDIVRQIAEDSAIIKEESIEEAETLENTEENNLLESNQKVKKVKEYRDVLEIPQYDILAYIYPNLKKSSLDFGVGWYATTRRWGELGKCVVAGHSSTIYNCILNDTAKMRVGDKFYVYDGNGKKHTYCVTARDIVSPSDMWVLSTVDETHSSFSMVTCTNNGSERLVITGTELSDEEYKTYMDNLYALTSYNLDMITETALSDYTITNYLTYLNNKKALSQ